MDVETANPPADLAQPHIRCKSCGMAYVRCQPLADTPVGRLTVLLDVMEAARDNGWEANPGALMATCPQCRE